MFRSRSLLLVFVAATFALGGCQKIKTRLGIGDLVTDPEPGSPERVLQDVLRAAKTADEEAGWQQFVKLLHSEESDGPAVLNNWREFKFRGIRKKVDLLLKDKSLTSFKIMDRRDDGKTLVILVENSASDMPTPCRLKLDPAQGNAWKVFNSCF